MANKTPITVAHGDGIGPASMAVTLQIIQEAGELLELSGDRLDLIMLSNRGTKVWPGGFPDTLTCDTWRCRFMSKSGPNTVVTHEEIIELLGRIRGAGFDFVKMESLCNFDGQAGYSLGQGQ
jgi:isocitrate dehydrogenase